MNNIQSNTIEVNDSKFFRKSMKKLSSAELFLLPIHNDFLKLRFKVQQMRSTVAEKFTPIICQFKEELEEKKLELKHILDELKDTLKVLDDVLNDIDTKN